jgi:hypothetical protein
MTITNTASRWAYPGNGVTTAFAYTNLIFAASDLKVYLDGVLQTTGYTVSNVGVLTGGNVTFSIPPANHASVVIVRDVPATQDIDYLGNDTFPAATHEKGLDKLTILAQQLAARLPRTLQLADGDPAMSIGGIPAVAERASKYLAFDAEGNPIAASGGPNAPVSAFAKTLLDDANAAAARDTIGLGGYINAKHFGATGDGWTDDTTALQNAYLAACAVKGTLFIPNGVYLTTGLTLGAATGQYCTIQGESFDTVGGGYGSILRLKAGSNANLISFGALNPGGLKSDYELNARRQ